MSSRVRGIPEKTADSEGEERRGGGEAGICSFIIIPYSMQGCDFSLENSS